MGDKKASSPTRRRVGTSAARGGSPPRHQSRSSRPAYNRWASQRGRARANDGPSSPEREQRQHGNQRPIVQDLRSPELFDSPGGSNDGLSHGSGNPGLNQIREFLEDVDNSISDASVISVHDDTSQRDRPTQTAAGSTNNSSPATYSSIHGGRPTMRQRLTFNGRTPNRGASHTRSRGAAQTSSSTGSVNTSQQVLSQNNSETNLSSNSESSLARRRFQDIPPLRFRSQNATGRLSSDSPNNQAEGEFPETDRPHIEPIQANRNSILQGFGTEDDPFSFRESPDTPDDDSYLLPSFVPEEEDVSPRLVRHRGSGGSTNSRSSGFSNNSSSLRRGGGGTGRGGSNRRGFGLAALRSGNIGGNSDESVFRPGRGVPSSPSSVLPPPGMLSDEDLARRLQEEEWATAGIGGGDDGLDEGLWRSVDSPLHLFGAGYHRRRPRFGLHLPPLSGTDDGNDDSEPASLANRSEELLPFFFDGPPAPRALRRSFSDRRRHQRHVSPFQIGALADLTDETGPREAVLRLLTALMSQHEMESLMGLESLDDANGGDYEALLALAERIGDVNKGLSEAEINKLPTHKHKPESSASKDESGAGAIGGVSPLSEQLQCHICLSDYESGDLKRLLPCGHDFHKDCVDTWLKTNATCPVCRSEVKNKRS